MSTLRNRLAALVDNPRVKASGRDLDFIKSMAAYYERTGRLTSGRKAWLDKLEAKYAADAPDHSDQSIANRISTVRNKVADGSWDANFLDSIAEQNRSRGQLSPRQVQILEKIEDNNSDDVIARRASWAESYTPEMAERMRVAAAYYLANPPYYRELANNVLNDENFIPSEKQYNALTGNKYAAKVLAAHYAEPAYPTGSKVEFRSSAGMRHRGKKGFVVKTDAKPVTRAARGTKIYMVLPVGEATPIFVEERHLKRGRF